MNYHTRISDSEWTVMRIIWNHPSIPATEVVEKLNSKTNWSLNTVKTFLARLEKKRILKSETIGRVKHYTANVSESMCQKQESEMFLQKVFQGRVGPALLHFFENKSLSDEELDQLRSLIEKSDKQ